MNFSSVTSKQFKIGTLPDIAQFSSTSNKSGNLAGIALGLEYSKNPSQKENPLFEKYYDFFHKTGILNTGLQALSGLTIMGLALFGRRKPGKHKLEHLFKGSSGKIYKIASTILGAGYLIGFPSVTGAGIKSEQPGMVLGSYMWLLASPFMIRGNLGTRTRALLDTSYAPTFAAFANQINNDYGTDKNKKIRKMDLDYMLEKETYLKVFSPGQKGKEIRKKLLDFAKFCVLDQVNVVKNVGKSISDTTKQSLDLLKGKRDKLPDIFSIEPSKASMSLGSFCILAGAIPKLIKGKKIIGKKELIADLLIGAGFLFESLGMMSLANAKKDSRRPAMLVGGPMRIIGDFRHENPFMYGLRTLGGSAFEYYWTLMNKDKKSGEGH